MRYIGIDYGEKKIGIAVSDAEGRIAFPKTTIINTHSDSVTVELRALVRMEDAEMIVVGMPYAFDGRETEQTGITREFIHDLRKMVSVPIEEENERFTTQIPLSEGVKKENVDQASAALILQSYLDRIRPEGEIRDMRFRPTRKNIY